MKSLIFAWLISASFQLSAQQMTDDPGRPTVGQAGQIFTIKWTPKSKKLEVAMVGTPAASIDPEKIVVLGRVFPAKGQPKKLDLRPVDGHFLVLDQIEPDATLEIEVKDPKSKKSETIKLSPKP